MLVKSTILHGKLTEVVKLAEDPKSDRGMEISKLEKKEIMEAIKNLEDDYTSKEIEVTKVASGYRIQAKKSINDYLNIIFAEKTPRYSRALMETLSIIAYKQPVTRGDIEAIRGVSVSSSIMRTLSDRNWIKIIGYRDVPGKPAMFCTTSEFLNYFGLCLLYTSDAADE